MAGPMLARKSKQGRRVSNVASPDWGLGTVSRDGWHRRERLDNGASNTQLLYLLLSIDGLLRDILID